MHEKRLRFTGGVFLPAKGKNMTDKDQYKVEQEPFYQQQKNEVALYEAAYRNRLPVMVKGPTGCGKSRFVE